MVSASSAVDLPRFAGFELVRVDSQPGSLIKRVMGPHPLHDPA